MWSLDTGEPIIFFIYPTHSLHAFTPSIAESTHSRATHLIFCPQHLLGGIIDTHLSQVARDAYLAYIDNDAYGTSSFSGFMKQWLRDQGVVRLRIVVDPCVCSRVELSSCMCSQSTHIHTCICAHVLG